jgi:predicted  nucleic acid-binding Zn-ribbon protein
MKAIAYTFTFASFALLLLLVICVRDYDREVHEHDVLVQKMSADAAALRDEIADLKVQLAAANAIIDHERSAHEIAIAALRARIKHMEDEENIGPRTPIFGRK